MPSLFLHQNIAQWFSNYIMQKVGLWEGVENSILWTEMGPGFFEEKGDTTPWGIPQRFPKFSSLALLFLSTDSRANANTVLKEATRKMCEKYQFYYTCLQIEIPRTEYRINIQQNNKTENTEHDNGD